MCLCEHYLLHVFRFELCYIVGNRTLLVYNIYTRLAKNLNISHLIYISFFPILHKIPLNISPTHCFHIRSCFIMKLCFISKFHVHVLKMCKLCFWMKKKKKHIEHIEALQSCIPKVDELKWNERFRSPILFMCKSFIFQIKT